MKFESPCPLARRGLFHFWKGAAHGQEHHYGVSGKEAGGFPAKKLEALSHFLKKKDTTIEAEMGYALARLYEKTVPPTVREFLEDTGTDGGVPQDF